jgi:hypothetical protein
MTTYTIWQEGAGKRKTGRLIATSGKKETEE